MKAGKLKKRKAKNSTKMKRKAISHVEMMLSFVIFIMFILVFFIVFNPFKRNVTNDSLADIVNLEIRKNTSIDVLTGSFSLIPCTTVAPSPSPVISSLTGMASGESKNGITSVNLTIAKSDGSQVKEISSETAKLNVSFRGNCSDSSEGGKIVSCELDYGDGSKREFATRPLEKHIYQNIFDPLIGNISYIWIGGGGAAAKIFYLIVNLTENKGGYSKILWDNHVYSSVGTYTAALIATDSDGFKKTDITKITIIPPAPSPSPSSSPSPAPSPSSSPSPAPSPAPSPTEELCYEKIKEKSCFSIKHLMKDFKKTPSVVIVKNETGSTPKFDPSGDNLLIKPSGRFYYLYYSEDFTNEVQDTSLGGCGQPLEEGVYYSLGITKERSIMSMKRLKALNITYWESYKSLKQYFRFPETNDFGFVVRNDTGDIMINSTRQRPRGLEVIVKQEPVEIIDETANLTYGKLDIFVW